MPRSGEKGGAADADTERSGGGREDGCATTEAVGQAAGAEEEEGAMMWMWVLMGNFWGVYALKSMTLCLGLCL